MVAQHPREELNADTSRNSLSAPREVIMEIIPKAPGRLGEPTGPHPEGSQSQDSCAVCLEDFEAAEKEDVWWTSCQHKFHVDCLENHFKTQRSQGWQENCPICRRLLLEEAKKLAQLEKNLTVEVDTPGVSAENIICRCIGFGMIIAFFVGVFILANK